MTTETDHIPSAEPDHSSSSSKNAEHDTPFSAAAATEAAPEEPADPEPEQLDPPAVAADQEDSLTPPESAQEPVAAPNGAPAGEGPLLTPEAESDLRHRWTAIQISFVENPRASVQDADALLQQIATMLLASFQERRSLLTAAWQWQDGQPDTEKLRLALRQYRSFIGAVLPVGP